MPKVQSIVEEVRKESEATSRMLERIPGDKLDWQPHAKSKSIGDLAYHIAALPALVVRTLLMNHTYHHRGQLSVYLRLLDVPVPIVYGNTADEKAF